MGIGGLALLALFSALLVFAYNPFQDSVSGRPVPTRWNGATITWFLNPSTPANNVDTSSGTTIDTAMTNAINSWPQTPFGQPPQILNNLTVTRGTPDSLQTAPNLGDCQNIFGFSDATGDFSTGEIAFAEIAVVFQGSYLCTTPPTTRTCSLPSCIVDADMEFNPADMFSTSSSPPSGKFDLQAVGTHESGHVLGLDHSGIAHAIMYPFGDTIASGQERSQSTDDIMGIAFLYPAASFSTATGAIAGTITAAGSGAFAAHVVVIDAATGNVVMDRLTNPDGTYNVVGVPPGNYNVVALPLARDFNSGLYTLDNFSGWRCGYTSDPSCKTGFSVNQTSYTGRFF